MKSGERLTQFFLDNYDSVQKFVVGMALQRSMKIAHDKIESASGFAFVLVCWCDPPKYEESEFFSVWRWSAWYLYLRDCKKRIQERRERTDIEGVFADNQSAEQRTFAFDAGDWYRLLAPLPSEGQELLRLWLNGTPPEVIGSVLRMSVATFYRRRAALFRLLLPSLLEYKAA